MIFVQFLASLALSLSSVNLWSENSWSGNSQSAVQQSTLISSSQDGPVRYYYIAEEVSFQILTVPQLPLKCYQITMTSQFPML